MRSLGETEVTLASHASFFSIAYRHYCEAERLVAERDQEAIKDDGDVDYICEKNAAVEQAAMVSVIFSALTLEAFINHYGIERLSRSFFDDHLDNLRPPSKWLILPKLILGRQINTSGEPFRLLRELFGLRNTLVHYKTRRKKIRDLLREDWLTEGHARDAIRAVRSVVEELQSIDPEVNIRWLQDAEKEPCAQQPGAERRGTAQQ